ncbi:MAG: glycine cleavage system aminomethyltransferase GcvT [Bdellovibrionaceae bacterium]|nr:glycine cleavage system aminomethyltransferase GcvT [Pseudobdellovibrionaceae bacterium]MCB9093234.1 glycine cleavage system aminomethyltransferase GcvT [Halobacteriovoraceae bacterium]
MQKTPLHQNHIELGARMVEFAGWSMPIQYKGLREEHMCTRTQVGIFDVSHMGEIRISGERAEETAEWLTSNYVGRLENGQAQYSLLTNENGGIVDDVIVYCVEKGKDYFICVNASNTNKDFAWMQEHNKGAKISNESPFWGQIAVQGPKAMDLIEDIFGEEVKKIPSFYFSNTQWQGAHCMIARTGYTGEDGCEIFISAEKALLLWKTLLEQGAKYHIQPIGLGARDTLRTEMKYSLYGHEIDDHRNPYEAGLGWVVKPQQKDFIGKNKIVAKKEEGLKNKLVGFKMLDKAIPRQEYKVFSLEENEIGFVTSGTMSPCLNEGIGIAYVLQEFADEGTEFLIQIRQKKWKAQVVKTPFVKPGGA